MANLNQTCAEVDTNDWGDDEDEWDEMEPCTECEGSGSLSAVIGDVAMSMDCPACGGYGYD